MLSNEHTFSICNNARVLISVAGIGQGWEFVILIIIFQEILEAFPVGTPKELLTWKLKCRKKLWRLKDANIK